MTDNLECCRLLIKPLQQPTPALFLDRDGVVIEDCHHLHDPDQVKLCLGAKELIQSAHSHGWPVVLITNQSGIARGFFQWHHFDSVNARMQELLGSDAPLAAIYANGHGPDAPANSWRKPSPRMVLEAAEALHLNLPRSLLIGDRLSDLQAGAAAGVPSLFHVLSGHGRSARASVLDWQARRFQKTSFPPTPCLHLLESLDLFPLQLLTHRNQPA